MIINWTGFKKKIDSLNWNIPLDNDHEKVWVRIKYINKGAPSDKAFIVGYNCYDKFGNILIYRQKKSYSESRKCYYAYVKASEQEEIFENTFSICPGAAKIEIKCHSHDKNARVYLLGAEYKVIPVFTEDARDYPALIENFAYKLDAEEDSCYELKLNFDWQGNPKGIVSIIQYDRDDNELMPDSQFKVHSVAGPYHYLMDGDIVKKDILINTVKNCSYIIINGYKWSKDGRIFILSPPELNRLGARDYKNLGNIKKYINNLNEADKCLVIWTGAPSIDRDQRLLRSSRLALYMAQNGWKVFYFPFNKSNNTFVRDGLIQISPEYKVDIVNALIQRTGKNNCFCISSFADVAAVTILDMAKNQDWQACYELHDDMEEFKRLGSSAWYNPILEKRVAEKCETLIATTPPLKEKLICMSGREDILLEPNGAPADLVEKASWLRSETIARERVKHKRVGIISHLTSIWFDWDIILKFAEDNPRIQIDIIGFALPKNIVLPLNAHYLGYKNLDECMPIAEKWSAGLIPFQDSRLSRAVSPNKAYDYLCMGLRVISSPMGEVAQMPLAVIYNNYGEFEKAIYDSFNAVSADELKNLDNYLLKNTWDARFAAINETLESMIK